MFWKRKKRYQPGLVQNCVLRAEKIIDEKKEAMSLKLKHEKKREEFGTTRITAFQALAEVYPELEREEIFEIVDREIFRESIFNL